MKVRLISKICGCCYLVRFLLMTRDSVGLDEDVKPWVILGSCLSVLAVMVVIGAMWLRTRQQAWKRRVRRRRSEYQAVFYHLLC